MVVECETFMYKDIPLIELVFKDEKLVESSLVGNEHPANLIYDYTSSGDVDSVRRMLGYRRSRHGRGLRSNICFGTPDGSVMVSYKDLIVKWSYDIDYDCWIKPDGSDMTYSKLVYGLW